MKRIILLMLLATLFTSCVPSVNPLFFQRDLVFKKSLLGKWTGENETWTFSSEDGKKYTLHHHDGEYSGTYVAHLLELKGEYFLDITAQSVDACNYLQKLTAFEVHTFARLIFIDEKMEIQFLSYEELDKGLKAEKLDVKHVRNSDGEILLTASTSELQEFVLNNMSLFDVGLELNMIDE